MKMIVMLGVVCAAAAMVVGLVGAQGVGNGQGSAGAGVSRVGEAAIGEARRVTVCELQKDPDAFNHELVEVKGFVTHGFEDFGFVDPECPARLGGSEIWLTYGGTAASNTIYCCPGEGANKSRPAPLVLEGVKVPLVADEIFGKFRALIERERDTTIRATLTGRFFAGETESGAPRGSMRGFGHMGCCTLLAIEKVEKFEPHERKDLDYSDEAGWYEKGKCAEVSDQDVRHVAVGGTQEILQGAIREQKLAESGEREWALRDPARVAAESVKEMYGERKVTVREIRRTERRVVYRTTVGKEETTVVVTRPYWLTFYSKTGEVVWVSTMVNKVECK